MKHDTHSPHSSRLGRALLLLLLIAALGTADCGGGGGDEKQAPVVKTVVPGQGVTVEQVDFNLPGGRDPYSTWGRLVLDPSALREAGLASGYICVVTEKGWAVVNMPVPGPNEPRQSMFFDLGLDQSEPLGATSIDVMHSSLPLRDVRAYTAQRIPFTVQSWVFEAHGVGPNVDLEKYIPPDDAPRVFELAELPLVQAITYSNLQAVTNVECANNQCFPMAVANGLQYLENNGAISVPHNHVMGLGLAGDPTLDTLVGQLDDFADRVIFTRRSGVGVWFEPMIDGLFAYLLENSLDGILTFRHQDVGYGETIPVGNYSALGSTSLNDGATVSWTWIDERMSEGCAVTMVYQPHAVRITGTGRTLGQYWIRYSHDANQSTDAAGLESVFTYLTDPDADGLLNMDGSAWREIRWVWAACP